MKTSVKPSSQKSTNRPRCHPATPGGYLRNSLYGVGGPKKPSDPIYAGEMRLIGSLKAEAAGIESLIGLEYATNLRDLRLGNKLRIQDWDIRSGHSRTEDVSIPYYNIG